MKKLLAIILIFIILPVSAETLKAGVEYSFKSIEMEDFENLPFNMDSSIISQNFNDPLHMLNLNAVKDRQTNLTNRNIYQIWPEITGNTAPMYAVNYKNKLQNYWFYYEGLTGWLINVLVIVPPIKYPYKCYMYNAKGSLVSVGYVMSDAENLTYDYYGKRTIKNINGNEYDKSGQYLGSATIRSTFIPIGNYTK